MTLRVLVASVLLAGSLVTTTAAQAAIKHRIDIPAQQLGAALAELARVTGIQLVYPARLVEGLEAESLRGSMTPEEALEKLLARTKLRFEFLDPGTVTLTESKSREPSSHGTGAQVGAVDDRVVRIAQGEPARQADAAASDGGVAGNEEPRTVVDEAGRSMPELLVKGKRSLNADIERTEDDVQPYVVFHKDEIQRAIVPNLEEFLKTRLPMNAMRGTGAQGASSIASNRSSIDLRGLGVEQTLILLNGRQMPKGNNAGAFTQPDINAIPLAAIERIEVLPSTASGIYGGGAMGGVINIITRQDYSGLQVSASYDNTFDTDSANRRFDASGGFQLAGGRTQVMMFASHADSNPLRRGDRDFLEQARALQLQNNPAAFLGTSTPPRGFTPNVRNSAANVNLRLKPEYGGTVLSSPFTSIPVGYGGIASDNAAALVANAGRYNLDQSRDIAFDGGDGNLISDTTVQSAMVNVRQELGQRAEAFVDVSWLNNESRSLTASLTNTVTVPVIAPNNPFTTPVVVRFSSPELSNSVTPSASDGETLRAIGGLIFRLPAEWTAAGDYTWSRSRGTIVNTFPVVGDADGAGPGMPVTNAWTSGALDVMRDVNAFPLDYTQYLMPAPNSLRESDTVLSDVALRVSGPVFRLPGGPLTLSTLMEHREEEAERFVSQAMDAQAVRSWSLFPARSQDVDSYYLEARVPLVGGPNARRFAQSLEVQASVRHDRYQTSVPVLSSVSVSSPDGPFPPGDYIDNEVDATKRTFGLLFSPVEDIVLRASSGTGFLSPSISQLVPGTPFQTSLTLTDPRRGNVPTQVAFARTCCGNPNLQAENSESWSAGLILTPRFAPALRVSVDYTRIKKTGEIALLSEQQMLDLEDIFAGRITRAALTPQDITAGFTGGAIRTIDRGQVNIAKTTLDAYDVQVNYRRNAGRFGRLDFYVVATWQRNFERQTLEDSPVVDWVEFNLAPLKWRGNAGITWERGGWMAGWSTQYYDSYFPFDATASPATVAASILNQGAARIPSQIYHDVQAGYRFDADSGSMGGLLADLELQVGVRNVFEEVPPIIATDRGGYSTFGDPRLRVYAVTLRKRF